MSITELVKAVGDDHIEVQSIHQNFNAAKVIEGGKVGVVTFNTAPGKVVDMMAENESKFIGMVLWMPRDRVDAAVKQEKQPTL